MPAATLPRRPRLPQRVASRVAPVLTAIAALVATPAGAQEFDFGSPGAGATGPDVQAELIAEASTIAPAEPFTVGVRLVHGPGWHTYWRNPGLGTPTSIDWSLPEGFTAGPIQWPVPKMFPFSGFVTYAYEDEAILLVEITPPADLAPDASATLEASVSWLACKESCIPGGQTVSLTLATGSEMLEDPFQASVIEDARAALPADSPAWSISAESGTPQDDADARTVFLRLVPESDEAAALADGDVYFFPDAGQIEDVENQSLTPAPDGDGYLLRLTRVEDPAGPRLTGIVASTSGWTTDGTPRAMPVSVVIDGGPDGGGTTAETESTTATATEDAADTDSGAEAAETLDGVTPRQMELIEEIRSWGYVGLDGQIAAKRGLVTILIFALLGGIILNIMPCVFPVLGIKIMGFVNQAGEDHAKIRAHGLVFGAGVVLSLWALVAVLLAVRALGSQAGWGFQLQNPAFLAFLIVLLFVFALSLSGVFEIGATMTSVGGRLQMQSGYSGSFFTGLLTVLVATPCTGPFMGPALAFAIQEPPATTYLVFTALAVGIALPYVLLSFFPGLVRKLPRPGPWMETFKQFMAFPLYATVVWLLVVFVKIVGPSALAWMLGGLLVTSFGAWIYGRYATPVRKPATQWIARAAAAAALVAFAWTTRSAIATQPDGPRLAVAGETIPRFGMQWEPFSLESLVNHRKKGRTVFIDFTADW